MALIENYRSFDIYFDTYSEMFTYNLDKPNAPKKQSYAACKKSIDDYIKEQEKFEPFRAIKEHQPTRYIIIVGFRKDGDFTVETPEGDRVRLSDYEENNYIVCAEGDQEIFAEIIEMDEEIERLQKDFQATVIDPIKDKKWEKRKLIKGTPLKKYKKELEDKIYGAPVANSSPS